MSLLNDALRDLEQRQAPAQMLELPTLMQPAPHRPWHRGWLSGVLMVASVAALGTGYWVFVKTPADTAADVTLVSGQRQVIEAEPTITTVTASDPSPVVGQESPTVTTLVAEQAEPISASVAVPVESWPVEPLPVEPLAVEPWPVEQADPVVAAESAEPAEPVQAARPVLTAQSVSPSDEPVLAEMPAEVVKESVALPAVAAPSQRATTIRTLTPEQQDRQTALNADRLLRNGRTLDAEDLLRQYLIEHPGAIQSRSSYAQFLIRVGRTAQAAQLLEPVDGQAPAELKQLKARLLYGQGLGEVALALLRQNPPALADQPDYHAFMALLHSEQGQFTDAVTVYAGLVSVHSQRADWWAGLGIALEGEGQPDGARRAYDQALALGGIHPELQAFVMTRRQAL